MNTTRTGFVIALLFGISSLIISCSSGTTPPGGNSIGGQVDGASYSFHYWEEGLAILIWQNASNGSGESCSGTGSTEDPVYRLECSVFASEERSYSWKVYTEDGVTADMWIQDQPIDLTKGAMFLVNIREDGVQVEQLWRDLSGLERSNQAISALAESDQDVANFIAANNTGGDLPNVNVEHELNEEYGLAEFKDALRTANQSVQIGVPIDQPFFSITGQIIEVNGEEVQVFEYPNSAAAAIDAAQIQPDASSVGTSLISWVATPHFYALDRIIALYVGDDQALLAVLDEILGRPIAQGQANSLQPPDTLTLLSEAFVSADYETLLGLMGESFSIGYWRSEGQILSPAQAIEQLRLNLLPDPAAVSFISDRAQFPDLGGIDPYAVFGPDVHIVDLIYSQGWGIDGSDEAILTIGQNADGSQYWHGMLIGRFIDSAAPPVQESPPDGTAIYRNGENGIELNYPDSWHLDEQVLGSRGSGALFYAAETDEEPVLSAVVYLWDPKNDLDAWLNQRSLSWSGSGASVLVEEELTLADGHRAIRVDLQWLDDQMTYHLFTEIGDRYLELVSTGDPGTFDEIIGSLRFVEPGS